MGRNSTMVWNEVKHKFPPQDNTSPVTCKYHRFPGMAASVPQQVTASNQEMSALELDERRACLVRYRAETRKVEIQNREVELDVLEKYRSYTVEHVRDARVNEMLQNDITNRKSKFPLFVPSSCKILIQY